MNRLLSLLMLLLISQTLNALPSDDTALIYIHSDSFHMEYKEGLATYQGHVVVDQGTRHLTADTLIIHRDSAGKVDKMTAYGKPAYFKTLPKPDNQWVSGHGDIIYNYPIQHNVELIQNAYLTQSGNSFSGDKIIYNTLTEIVDSPDSKTGQSLMVLQPANQNNQNSQN